MIYATGNTHKFEEAKNVFEDLEMRDVETLEIQGEEEDIVRDKCLKAYAELGRPVIVDDVSFNIEMLGGFPGPYIKSFIEGLGARRIGELFEGSVATARCMIAYTDDGEDVTVVEGVVEGEIVLFTEGRFGFDPVFKPLSASKTWGEMSVEEKNKESHRSKALQSLASLL